MAGLGEGVTRDLILDSPFEVRAAGAEFSTAIRCPIK